MAEHGPEGKPNLTHRAFIAVSRAISPPVFPDPEKTLTALVLNSVIWSLIAVLVAASAIGLPLVFVRKGLSAGVIGVFLAILLLALGIMRSGRVVAASRLLSVFLWLVFVALASVSGGIESVNLIFLLSVTVQAGLTCGSAWALGIAAASIMAILAFASLDALGTPPPRLFPTPPFARWLMLTLGISVTMVSLVISLTSRIRAITRAREEIRVRKETEEALAKSEERFRTIFDSLSEVVFIHRLDGTILDVNRKAVEAFGWSREDILSGAHVSDLSATDQGFTEDRSREFFARAAAGESLVFEWRAKRKDGSLFWSENRMKAADIAGERRILVTGRDIEDRVRGREERDRLERSLLQSQKMESVGRLAGGVAHDFNNLLTGILGNLDLALLEEGSPEIRQRLEDAKRAGGRAAELTKQLLALSRKQIIEPVPIDLRELVSSMKSMLSRILGETIGLEVGLPEEPCAILADPSQMEHMILNLAVNARDAMPSGGLLSLRLRNEPGAAAQTVDPGGAGTVSLTVSDTGTGMPAEVLSRAFQPFFTTKERGKGTGLGLSIVFGIVSQNGGTIEARSTQGEGAAFIIRFPRLAGAPGAVRPPEEAARALGGKESVLLVEDEGVVRDIAIRTLARSGYSVNAYASAEEALAALPSLGRIDILVTDVILPGLNGREMAELVSSRRPGIRVLYVSGYPSDVIADSGIIKKGIDFLPKPFSPSDLAAKVRSVLDDRPRG